MEGLCLDYGSDDDSEHSVEVKDSPAEGVQGLPGLLGYSRSVPEELEQQQLQPQSIDLGPLGGRVGGSAEPEAGSADASSPQESDTTAGQAVEMLEEDDPAWGLPEDIREPPPGEPDPRLVAKVKQFLDIQRSGKGVLTDSLKQTRAYRNPDYLRQAVEYVGMNEFGTCFPSDRFDPTDIPVEDFAVSLGKEFTKYDEERKRKASQIDLTKTVQDKVSALASSGATSQVKKSVSSLGVSQPSQLSRRQKWDSLPKAKD